MDHATAPTSSSKRSGHLHRGALKEIRVDRLLNKPLHEQNQLFKPSSTTSSSSSSSSKWVTTPVRNTPSASTFTFSESRNPLRRRSASGSYSPGTRLFEDEDIDSIGTTHLLASIDRKEAFVLKADLKRRRKTSPTRTNNDSRQEREKLMESIRKGSSSRSKNRQRGPRSKWIIPMDHPFKAAWDIVTVMLSILNAYARHVSIRERNYEVSPVVLFMEVWFFLDILLNFFTERKTGDGEVLQDYRSICARYLTSWFAVDLLALVPWEMLYVKPIVDLQKRRGFFTKSFFRSKAVVRVSRHLRGRHFRWFGRVAKHTKQHGVGAKRLLQMIIKYVPKYVMFLRNMKGIVAFRLLRQFHWFRRFYRNLLLADDKSDAMTGSMTKDDEDDLDDFEISSKSSNNGRSSPTTARGVQIVYAPWETVDDDDGVFM